MNWISKTLAFRIALITLLAVVAFHLLVISGIIPYQYVWGGRLQTYEQMIEFEIVSLALNVVFILILNLRMQKISAPPIIGIIGIWLMVAVFALNTIGNLLAAELIEKVIFTPITAILAILCFRLAIK